MNYDKLYYQIIERAIKETRKAIRYKGNGTYYELHHIIPRSFGGSDKANNLVLLTAREHFIAHWILVKRYEKGSVERNKMLFALWRMQSNPMENERYRNSRTYEKLRIEFATTVGKMTAALQIGSGNSQYGKHWYTSIDTGESKKFFEKPNDRWIKGRNFFQKQKTFDINSKNKIKKDIDFDKKAKELWNDYHSGNYKSLRDYQRIIGYNPTKLFKLYIPIFKKNTKRKSLYT